MRSTTNCVITNNSIHDNYRGVETSSCSNLRITGNDVQMSCDFGIAVRGSSDCVIDHNTVVANERAGLDLADFSNNVTVTWNYFAGNNWGIYFQLLHYSTVHHNDFVGNMANVYTHVAQPDNSWDDGYPSGGNYWSDYSGSDSFSGPGQDLPGSDGFGDEPYEVRGSSGGYYDYYPFMDPLLGPEDTPPVALFTVEPTIGDISTEFVLNASMSYDAEDPTSELEVRWDVGYDGSWEIDWSKEKVVTWQFTSIGDYLIRLEVRDTHMLLNDTSLVVHVAYVAPVASFVVSPTTGSSSTSFVFNASGSSDPDDGSDALEVHWDWENDGTWDTAWSTSKVATHAFSTDGTYTVALQVRDPGGLDASATRQVVVESIPPTADAGSDQTVEVGASVTLDGSGSTDNVGVVNFTWSCVIGGEAKEAFGMSSAWSFAEPGTFEVVLTVRDAAGSTDTDTVTITVEMKEPGGSTIADYWWVAPIAAIALALIAVLYVMVRRGKGGSVR
jgi:parallel beta-helix repeat protein